MGDDQKKDVTRLLKRGLNQYGLGDLEGAIQHWEQALALDPKNRAARDYLETAYDENTKQPAAAAVEGAPQNEASANAVGEAEPAFDDDDTPSTPTGPGALKMPDSGEEPNTLIEQALTAYKEGRMEDAWGDLQVAAEREPQRLDVQGYIAMMRSERARAFARVVGDQGRVVCLQQTMKELMQLNLSPDEGFLLSQIDGEVTIEQLLTCPRTASRRYRSWPSSFARA